ncbi:MAG: SHOCT domain-containing protein [Acidimicrobiales bacterium]|nr:SHOCT domain-containing protein [Acidimicrobiales bacterium]
MAEVGFAELFWTVLWLFFLFMFIWVFVALVSDLFRDHSLSGAAKAVWIVVLVLFPLLGSLVYLIVRGGGMAERSAKQAQRAQAEFDSYIRATAASTGTSSVDDLTRLSELRANGTLTEAEFESLKARIVGGESTAPA